MQKLYLRVVGTTPSKLGSFASTVTRAETSLDDPNGVWQKDRCGKFNNYLNVDLEVQDEEGQLISLEWYCHVEAELRLVMEDGELGDVIDRVNHNSKRIMNKHLEGSARKLMIIDADPQSGAGLRVGGTSRTTIKTRINELSKRGSRNSRFSVIYRPVGEGGENFVIDPKAASSRPLTIYSKVVKSAKDEAVNDHLEQAKLAAKALLSEVEKVDSTLPSSSKEAALVMEILEACRLIQKKLAWQENRQGGGGAHGASHLANQGSSTVFDVFDSLGDIAATSQKLNPDIANSLRDIPWERTDSTTDLGAGAEGGEAINSDTPKEKRQRVGSSFPSQSLMLPYRENNNGFNVIYGGALDTSDDFSIDLLEDYIRERELDDGTVNVTTTLDVTKSGISISLFDDDHDGEFNRDDMARTIARLDIPLTAEMQKRIFEEFDTNNDGVITVKEFIAGVKKREAELIPIFQQIDIDGDGYLTFEELRQSSQLQDISNEAIKELIAFVDSLSTEEPDGRISMQEFVSTFTMLPSGNILASLQTFAKDVSLKRRASSSSM